MLTYEQALAYLGQFINYETRRRVPYLPEHFNLEAFGAFLHELGDPHRAFPSVHVAGSKGKGSTAAMIEAILAQAGLRTGLFTNPHLVTLRERTQVNRELISREAFAALVAELRDHLQPVRRGRPRRFRTFFELTTALSFLHFARQAVDAAVVEVGLGGRLDTTNVLTPQVAVLTPIGLEHTHILGDTLGAIAGEKAGIIKPGACVVSAAQEPEAAQVFEQRCREQGAILSAAGRDFDCQVFEASAEGTRMRFRGFGHEMDEITVPLVGRHQAANAAVAVAVSLKLREQGWKIDDAHIVDGLAGVNWEGRAEVIDREPWVVLDAAHTVESARSLADTLGEAFEAERLFLVLGMASDKNVEKFVATLAPLAREVVVTAFRSPRACKPQRLADEVRRHGIPVRLAETPEQALALARAAAGPADAICVTGSVLLLGELKSCLLNQPLEFSG
ncbi:MAG: Mur ligase family protein [Candidatus Tectomicrobia bacterium]|nr:Mur ligase family protein [Candidatus Tectomicrobia bacterium]